MTCEQLRRVQTKCSCDVDGGACLLLRLPSFFDNCVSDAGLDEYVYGGPRTHTQIETVKAKDIHVPTWFVIQEEKGEKGDGESSGGRSSRSLALGSKYAKPRAAPRANGRDDGESSDELTDDDVYLARHRPYEEQEVRFRYLFESSVLRTLWGCDVSLQGARHFLISCTVFDARESEPISVSCDWLGGILFGARASSVLMVVLLRLW